MFARILIATVGALLVTTILLLGMDAVTTVFRERSSERGYRISDVITRDRSGRPEMPEPPARLPSLPEAASEPGAAQGGFGVAPPAPAPAPRPDLAPVTLEPAFEPAQPPSSGE